MLLVCWRECKGRVVEKAREIVREVLEYHEAVIALHHDLLQLDDIVVVE